MYGRKIALRIMILSIGTIIWAGCGEVQSGQSAPGTAEIFETETVDISEDMTVEASADQPEDHMAEVSTEQSADGTTEQPTDRPEDDAAEPSESEEEEDSAKWTKLSVPTLPATGCELSDFVPEGWKLIDSVELDYNEDGITDYVGVQEVPPDEEKDGWWYFSPGFRILFGIVSEGPGQYRLDFQDENLIRTWDEGGAFGDPYEPPTLYQAGKQWAFSLDRVTDWEVSRIVLAEGIELSQEKIRIQDDVWLSGYNYHDEDCVLYTFSCSEQDDQRKDYLAMHRWQDKSLNILAEEYSINEDMMQVYGDKIYYIAFYKSLEGGQNIVKEEKDVIGVRLNRINLDGTGKEIIFDLPDKGMRIMDISGGEIIVEVYEEGPNAVYRMDVDGGNLRQIGQIPDE